MKLLLAFIGWCLLLVLCWPLALIALVLSPIILVLSIPFHLAGVVLGAVFGFIAAVLFLPARMLGRRT